MVLSRPKAAIRILRQEGFISLMNESKDFVRHRAIPMQVEIKIRYRINQLKHNSNAVANPLRILYIDPAQIHLDLHPDPFSRKYDIGKILTGGWDKNRRSFNDRDLYRGLKQHFEGGFAWTRTAYFQRCMKLLKERGSLYGCSDREEFLEQRCSYLDELYENIKSEGYKQQKDLLLENTADLNRRNEFTKRHKRTHEVAVHIGRNGELLVCSGQHRLAIAKILGIEKIPVVIVVRHQKWQQFRDDIVAGRRNPTDTHPDLYDVV